MEILRLTDAKREQGSAVLYESAVSSSAGLSITFDFYAYGGTGGDGFSFIMFDAAKSPQRAGGFGGSLGYAPRIVPAEGKNEPGFDGGYLAVGFDAYGNFSNPEEGRIGGVGEVPDGIAVRGSQATGYTYLTGTPASLPYSLDNANPGSTRDQSRRIAKIDLTPTGELTIQIDANADGDYADPGEQIFNNFSVIGAGNGALPSNFRFGFAATTGSETNIHEIGNFSIKTFAGADLPGSFANLVVSGGGGNDKLPSSGGDDVVDGQDGNDNIVGDAGNDTLLGGSGKDVLNGGVGDDLINGGLGADRTTGGTGADKFVFSGNNKRAALRTSTVKSLDRITDFNAVEGDRLVFDFDNNGITPNLPKSLTFVGKVNASNLEAALTSVFADRLPRKRGNQGLGKDSAVLFKFKRQTIFALNDNKGGFSAQNDFVLDVSGITFATGGTKPGALNVTDYLA